MQLEIATSKRFEADAVGRFHLAIGCQIRSPGGQGSHHSHARHGSQSIARAVWLAHNRAVVYLDGNTPRGDGGLAADRKDAKGFHHSISASGRVRSPSRQCSMGSILGIEVIIL